MERSTLVAVKIRLKRMGKIRAPFYRVVVMDSRTKRDGRAIEEIGKYHPTEEPSLIDIDVERANYWIGQGAQPTEAVAALLKKYAEGTVQTKAPKPAKKDLYEAALAAAGKSGDDASGATTARKRAAKKAEEPKADDAKADAPKAEEAKAEEPKADEAKAEEPKAAKADAPKADAPKAEEPKAEEPVAADTDSGAASAQAVNTEADAGAEADAAASTAELPEGAAAALEGGAAPEGYTIKGNKDSMKYHEPDGQWYDQTVAEVWFKTAADAEKAGFEKAGGSH
jgi:small subunit ribosomal protein S16